MSTAKVLWFSVLISLLMPFVAHAENAKKAVEPTRQQLETQISILIDQINLLKNALELQKENAVSDPELKAAMLKARIKEYEYRSKVYQINIDAFDAQWWATYVILLLVIIVVCAGVAFSGFQLAKSVTVAGIQSDSNLELSATKVRLTSSVVGIVVLLISLVFLYLYINDVYEVKYMDTQTGERQRSDGKHVPG